MFARMSSMVINNTQTLGNNFMIYRDGKPDLEYVLRRKMRYLGRLSWRLTRKVLSGINYGVEELVREANKKS